MGKIRAAVVGLGYWGPNLARNFQSSRDYELVGLCDRMPDRLARVADSYPWAQRFDDLGALLAATQPELVAIATPVATHHALARQALVAGCHVLCEKPLAATVQEASDLVETADRLGRHLFVDHTFAYTGAVRALRDLQAAGHFGRILYVDSVRINLGLFQPDVDVIWDLAPHDLSILGHVSQSRVVQVWAHGSSHNPRGMADVAYVSLQYEAGWSAHMHLSWLSPVKVRQMIVAGTESSAIYDDLEPSEKIKIYGHGVSFDVSDLETRLRVQVNYRRGDMRAPALDNREALGTEMAEIAAALRGGPMPPGTGLDGLEVVRLLEAASRSMASDGARITP